MKKQNHEYPAKQISESTDSFSRFSKEMQQSEMLMSYLEVGSKLINQNKAEAKKHFLTIYDNIGNPDDAKSALSKMSDQLLDVNYYVNHLSAMIYVRSLDNFITYFKEILSEIVAAKPQILKSQESENLEFI